MVFRASIRWLLSLLLLLLLCPACDGQAPARPEPPPPAVGQPDSAAALSPVSAEKIKTDLMGHSVRYTYQQAAERWDFATQEEFQELAVIGETRRGNGWELTCRVVLFDGQHTRRGNLTVVYEGQTLQSVAGSLTE